MSAILIHGYVPRSMLMSVIVPIIKDKNKRISDMDRGELPGLDPFQAAMSKPSFSLQPDITD